jgi:hypothetical protein
MLFACVVALASCGHTSSLCETGVKLRTVPSLSAALADQLQSKGIEFEVTPSGDLCYSHDDREVVRELERALVDSHQPTNQVTVPGGEFAHRLVVELDKAGIRASFTNLADREVIVIVDSSDMPAVRLIIEKIDGERRGIPQHER